MHVRRMLGCTVAPVKRGTVALVVGCSTVAPMEGGTVALLVGCSTVAPVEGGAVAPVESKVDKQRVVPLEGHLPQLFHWERRECHHGRLFSTHCDLDFEHGEPTRGA